MRVALAQIDAIVGNIDANVAALLIANENASKSHAVLCVTSELSVCGYPPRDLLLREGFVEACERAVEGLARQCRVPMLVTSPRRCRETGTLRNSVALIRGGVIERWYDKQLLPSYDVFDEHRYFRPGESTCVFDCDGERVGVLVCEDLWRAEDVPGAAERSHYGNDPVDEAVKQGATMLCIPSASPFRLGRRSRQHAILTRAAVACDGCVVHVNQAGANDDVIFDGESAVVTPSGALVAAIDGRTRGHSFRDDLLIVETTNGSKPLDSNDEMHDLFGALVCSIEGYFRKTGHSKAILGLSGGIDSALVAALCVRALGSNKVRGVMMPSIYSSSHSIEDARATATALGMAMPDLLPIERAHALFSESMQSTTSIEGLADENLQSRLRGLTLMTLSNATNALVVSTGNKSELATGYATLYGDMCGSIMPIGDVLKTQVYTLARWMNSHWRECGFSMEPIPVRSIEKAPSAELRPDQTDQQSLPPYETIDLIVRGAVDLDWSPDRIASEYGIDLKLVNHWCIAIDRNQFKRAQAPVVPKVSQRAFGPGRRMPLAARPSPGSSVSD
ncbi:MAG: NAD+ synthase [Planctomycetota bacterium]|nr:NAD+ synthase [Planctomycetota bacterium]